MLAFYVSRNLNFGLTWVTNTGLLKVLGLLVPPSHPSCLPQVGLKLFITSYFRDRHCHVTYWTQDRLLKRTFMLRLPGFYKCKLQHFFPGNQAAFACSLFHIHTVILSCMLTHNSFLSLVSIVHIYPIAQWHTFIVSVSSCCCLFLKMALFLP